MTSMIERVARAIYDVNPWVSVSWDDLPSTPKAEYREKAKAAIEAMRADLEWSHTVVSDSPDYDRGHVEGQAQIKGYIDAALNP